MKFVRGKAVSSEYFLIRERPPLVRRRTPATVPAMSFQEVKNIEGEVSRLEKMLAREKNWGTRKHLAEELMFHCRRLADLEKRAFVSAKVHSEEWIPRLEKEQDLCELRPLEEAVASLANAPFSADNYEARKQRIEVLLASIIERQHEANDPLPFRALLERLWQISVGEDENFESHLKLRR